MLAQRLSLEFLCRLLITNFGNCVKGIPENWSNSTTSPSFKKPENPDFKS
jgi:hypothetical protein